MDERPNCEDNYVGLVRSIAGHWEASVTLLLMDLIWIISSCPWKWNSFQL